MRVRHIFALTGIIACFISASVLAKGPKDPKPPKEMQELSSIGIFGDPLFFEDPFIWHVRLLGKTAYVSISDSFGDPEARCRGIEIYDLEDPENPVLAGAIPCLDLADVVPGLIPPGVSFLPPAALSVMEVKTKDFKGTVLAQSFDDEFLTNFNDWFFGFGGPLAPLGLALWDVTDPAAPVPLGTVMRSGPVTGDSFLPALFSQGKDVLVATQLITPGNFATGPLPASPEGLYVFDITEGLGGPPRSWDPVGSFTIPPFPYPVGSLLHWQFSSNIAADIVVDKKGKVASIAASDAGFWQLDISDPANITEIGHFEYALDEQGDGCAVEPVKAAHKVDLLVTADCDGNFTLYPNLIDITDDPAEEGEINLAGVSQFTPQIELGPLPIVPITNDDFATGDNTGCLCDGFFNPNPLPPYENDVTGKIALVRRGACRFDAKVAKAQLEGAAGVIIANVPGGDIVDIVGLSTISDFDFGFQCLPVPELELTIPATFVSGPLGEELWAAGPAGTVHFADFSSTPPLGGPETDWGIVATNADLTPTVSTDIIGAPLAWAGRWGGPESAAAWGCPDDFDPFAPKFPYGEDTAGKFAVVRANGNCSVADQVTVAEAQGATGVGVIADGGPEKIILPFNPTIPVVSIARDRGEALDVLRKDRFFTVTTSHYFSFFQWLPRASDWDDNNFEWVPSGFDGTRFDAFPFSEADLADDRLRALLERAAMMGGPISAPVTTPLGPFDVAWIGRDDGFGSPQSEGCPVDPFGLSPDLSAPAVPYGESVAGKIALIARGSCFFSQKILIAQNLGAVGVIIINGFHDVSGFLGGDPTGITIPAVLAGRGFGDEVIGAHLAGEPVQIGFEPATTPVDVTMDIEPGEFMFPGGNYATLNIPPPVDGYGTVRLLDFSDPASPTQAGQIDLPITLDPAAPVNFPADIAAHKHDAFIAWKGFGVLNVDVKEPDEPKIKAIGAADNPIIVETEGSLLVVGDGGFEFPAVPQTVRIFKR